MRLVDQSHLKGRRVYKCSHCGFAGVWTDSWSWYGSLKELEEGKPPICACSEECQQALTPTKD